MPSPLSWFCPLHFSHLFAPASPHCIISHICFKSRNLQHLPNWVNALNEQHCFWAWNVLERLTVSTNELFDFLSNNVLSLVFPVAGVALCQSVQACIKLSLTTVQNSDHLQGLLLPADLLWFKVRICKSNVVSQIASVQMRLVMHPDTVISPRIIHIYAERQVSEQSGRKYLIPDPTFYSCTCKLMILLFFLFLSSEREHIVCVE